MAKPRLGGQRQNNTAGVGGPTMSVGTAPATPQVTPKVVIPPTPQQVMQGNVLPTGGVPFDQFMRMTDDEKADVITDALGVGLPMFLDDSGLQRLAYYTGMSDKPTVVSDTQLDSIKGQQLFRGVYNGYNSGTDIGYTSTDIYKQIAYGDFTMYSDSGGSAYGKAIYFGNTFSTARAYASNGSNPIVMRAKITGGKMISVATLNRMYSREINAGTKLARACSKADGYSRKNLFALAKGYSIVTDNNGYYMVLNRGAITMSDTTKPARGSSW